MKKGRSIAFVLVIAMVLSVCSPVLAAGKTTSKTDQIDRIIKGMTTEEKIAQMIVLDLPQGTWKKWTTMWAKKNRVIMIDLSRKIIQRLKRR